MNEYGALSRRSESFPTHAVKPAFAKRASQQSTADVRILHRANFAAIFVDWWRTPLGRAGHFGNVESVAMRSFPVSFMDMMVDV